MLFKTVPQTLLRIDTQALLRTHSQALLKTNFKSAKTCEDCTIKTLNKIKRNYAENASKFEENFIIYLNSLAFSLQSSFINFKFFKKIMERQRRVFYFRIVVNQAG